MAHNLSGQRFAAPPSRLSMWTLMAFYAVKPLVPRAIQLYLRRRRSRYLLANHLHKWPVDLRTNDKPRGWQGWPNNSKFALVLTHDIESTRGVELAGRVMDLESELGFRSSFNFVAEDYPVPPSLRARMASNGFEVGLHGIHHTPGLYFSEASFLRNARKINRYLGDWGSVGFRSPAMYRNLEWLHKLDIKYDASTFDTDPFEPQPDGAQTIFPFLVDGGDNSSAYVELPYTLPQDFTMFVILQEQTIDIWKRKLEWLAENGGMALVITHPDYMHFGDGKRGREQYPATYYKELLEHIKSEYEGLYWHALPRDVAGFWKERRCGH